MDKDTTADIRGFLRPELTKLQAELHAAGMPANKNQVASGMVHAATELPVRVVKAMLESYFSAEASAYAVPEADDQT